MKISVVMAVYNGSMYLLKQLESINMQTKKIDEVIIVDDCSSDDSKKIVTSFIKEKHLDNWKLVENEVNLGYKKNFRKGLTLCTGDIIFFADQDDIWHLDKIEKMSDIMKKNQILTLASSCNFINQDDEIIDIEKRAGMSNNNLLPICVEKKLTKIDLEIVIMNNFAQGCTMAFDKSVKQSFLNNSIGLHPHDWEINLIGAINGSCYYLDEALIDYRIHDNNTIGLSSILEQDIMNEKSKRLKNRIELTSEEKTITEFVLSFKELCYNDYLLMSRRLDYLNMRLDGMNNNKYFLLFKSYILGKYSVFGTFKTFIGDLIVAINKR
ncbi:MAG: glycosyltransferase [Thomasclavelia sp.]|uniref:glycosyltransferase n=1 Tax=Thomasclavelia sp. TaxID=3025757 RepID=UPI0039A30CF4